jgi:hypothetical protein
MSRYEVVYPIVGSVIIYDVEADNEKEAIERGFDLACEILSGGEALEEHKGCIDTLEICDPIAEGNTLHASLNESYAEKKK